MKSLIKYLHLWKTLTMNSFQSVLTSRLSASLFLLGKFFRFIFFSIFLFALFSKTTGLAEYSFMQVIFFYLTFNVMDTATQLFFREVYRFRQLVVSGDFDFVLVKPIHPLFRSLVGGADPLDLCMLVPYIGSLVYVGSLLPESSIIGISLYMLLLLNGFIIATAFHILVLALAVMTTEIDHSIMIYRDLTSMGRVPMDIYHEPLRSFITFGIPVGIMMTYPAKAFMNLLSWANIVVALFLGIIFFWCCLYIWRYSLKRYSSASS